jgi:hypothetical protein
MVNMVTLIVATLALGSRPRQGNCKVVGLVVDPGVTSHAPGSAKSVREWTLTLPSELPWWELVRVGESWSPKGTAKTSKSNLKGQNSMACGAFYMIENLLERRCLKWSRIAHLDIWNTSYGQKKGRESNCQFDFRPKKVGNRPDLLGYRERTTYRWKDLDKIYNFALDRISIWGLFAKLWCSQVTGVPTWPISRLPGQKAIWM